MTFADGVLRLVRGSREPVDEAPALKLVSAEEIKTARVEVEPLFEDDGADRQPLHEPGFADIEAAVELVSAGLARRIILANFPSWPGLLWRAYQLAEQADVLILPTVVRPGGRVDIVVTRERE